MASNSSAQGTSPGSTSAEFPLHDLRVCFYALLPQETYYESVADVPGYIARASFPWGLILILIEVTILRHLGKNEEWRLHSAFVSFSSYALFEGFSLFVLRGLELGFYQWTYDNVRFITLPWDAFGTFVVTLIAMEFGAYWWHRLSHEVAIMWASHELHHSSDDFNLSVAFRNSATIRFFRWIFYLPLAFLGVPTSIMLTHYVLGGVYNGIIHHNAVPKFEKIIPVLGKVIDFVFVTPSHHRVHHASNKYCLDKNYGQYTILFDRLFGTFAEEKEEEPLVYGTLTQPMSYDIATLQISSYIKLWNKYKGMNNFTDRMKTLFFGPGWLPGTPRLGNPDDIPDVKGRKKYSPKLDPVLAFYLALNCLCTLLSYIDMAGRVKEYSQAASVVALLYVWLSYTAIGGYYGNKTYASSLDLIRIFSFFCLYNYYPLILGSSYLSYFVYCANHLVIAMLPFVRIIVK